MDKVGRQVLIMPRMNGRGAMMTAWLDALKKADPSLRIVTPSPRRRAGGGRGVGEPTGT